MSVLEICILVAAVALVLFTVVYNVVRKLRGRSGCGCADKSQKGGGCSGACGHCGADCPYRKQ